MKQHLFFLILYFFLFSELQAEDSQSRGVLDGVFKINLDTAKLLALENSIELKEALSNMKIQEEVYYLSFREYLPSVKVNFTNNNSVLSNADDTRTNAFSLTIKQPIFNGGKSVIQKKLDYIQLKISNEEASLLHQSILDQCWDFYFQLVIFLNQLEIQKEKLVIYEKQFLIANKKYELEMLRDLDMKEAKLQFEDVKIAYDLAEIDITIEKETFKLFLGLDRHIQIVIDEPLDSDHKGIDLTEKFAPLLYDLALSKNLEYRKMDLEALRLNEQKRQQYFVFIPAISGECTITTSGNKFPLQNYTVNGKINVSFPLPSFPIESNFTMGTSNRDEKNLGTDISVGILEDFSYFMEQKKLNRQIIFSNEKKEYFLRNLYNSVRISIQKYEQEKKKLDLKRKTIENFEQRMEIEEKLFEYGELTQIQFYETQNSYYESRIALFSAILELMKTERAIEKSIGLEPGELVHVLRLFKPIQQGDNNEM